uniref:BTB domain-containing protein n=1 Tax=Panagrolaimus sp. JU765 TaxID=591449 RepID=A0AC34Q7L4_9BILA
MALLFLTLAWGYVGNSCHGPGRAGGADYWELTVRCPVPISISFTLELPIQDFIYEKTIFSSDFEDRFRFTDDSRGTSGVFNVCCKPILNPFLNDLIENGGVGDFVIVAEDQEIKINKELLEIHSPVFAAMFKSDYVEAKENRVTIEDFSFDVVKFVVKSIYFGGIPENTTLEIMEDVCRFVDKYDMKKFKDYLEECLDSFLTFYDACKVTMIAQFYKCTKLYENGIIFLASHMKKLRKMNDFKKLDMKVLHDVMEAYGAN